MSCQKFPNINRATKPRTHSTIGWCTTCRRNLTSTALRIWHAILPIFFSNIKHERACICLSLCSHRWRPEDVGYTTEPSQLPTLVGPSEFNTCIIYVEANNPLFDPKRVLLRSLFFSDVDRTKCLYRILSQSRLPTLSRFWNRKKERFNFHRTQRSASQ